MVACSGERFLNTGGKEIAMCGLCGIVRFNGIPVSAPEIAKMTRIIHHRGPDDEGIWVDGEVGLGHKRLAIIDLTPSGHQPMGNESGDVLIVYNGELYNHLELRLQLESAGHTYHSRSDTETIIHAYEEWGEDCLMHFNGMFAFAIWDRHKKKLFLARDRFGVKPLYYYFNGRQIIFASEIKAILENSSISRSVCYTALNEYFTFQNILTDKTLFQGILILQPGHSLSFDVTQETIQIKKYWDYDFSNPHESLSLEEASEELHDLFSKAVARQLMSDVPLGCYLSGGMDSGSITAVASQYLGRLTTFTGGFDLSSASGLELGFDERAEAEMLSNLLKTEHYEMVMHAGDMEHVMPSLIWHLEDLRVGQCYPNYYIARLASKFVKVMMSGAGGDELFGGYPWRYYRGMNSPNSGDYFINYYHFWQRLVMDEDKPNLFNSSTHYEIKNHSTFDIFQGILKSYQLPLKTSEDFVNASLYFELKTFLHGLLVVEDKVSMAHSLETRVPFLDNDLVDFACRIPVRLKLRRLQMPDEFVDENDPAKRRNYFGRTQDGKLVLRETMKKIVPYEMTERIKKGFSAPDASWFRGESIDYVNSLLRNHKALIYEYITPEYVIRRLDEHTSGQQNHRLFIWSLLSFEWWLREFLS
jgi:asparagine synthase (glutamine-hydrolysing)